MGQDMGRGSTRDGLPVLCWSLHIWGGTSTGCLSPGCSYLCFSHQSHSCAESSGLRETINGKVSLWGWWSPGYWTGMARSSAKVRCKHISTGRCEIQLLQVSVVADDMAVGDSRGLGGLGKTLGEASS